MMELNLPGSWLVWALGIGMTLLLFRSVRSLVGAVFSAVLTPGFLVVVTTVFLWAWWIVKKIWTWHLIVLRNLMRPHNVIFPTLERVRERRKH